MIDSIQNLESKDIYVIYDHDIHQATVECQVHKGIIADVKGPFDTTTQDNIHVIIGLQDCFTDECCAKTELYAREYKRQQALSPLVQTPEDIILFLLSHGIKRDEVMTRYIANRAFEKCFGYPVYDKLKEMTEKIKERE